MQTDLKKLKEIYDDLYACDEITDGEFLLFKEAISEIEALRKGEYICKSCGVRKNDDYPKGDF